MRTLSTGRLVEFRRVPANSIAEAAAVGEAYARPARRCDGCPEVLAFLMLEVGDATHILGCAYNDAGTLFRDFVLRLYVSTEE